MDNFSYRVIGIGDGALLGVTFYGKDDRLDEEDWNELNLYFFVIAISIRWS